MELVELLSSGRSVKAKSKAITEALLAQELSVSACRRRLPGLGPTDRATLLEGIEGATRDEPSLVDKAMFVALVDCLEDEAPKVKWEAARTLANVAALHKGRLGGALHSLFVNATHEGKVVRWATAQALAAFVRAGFENEQLNKHVRASAKNESDDGVRKVYAKVVKHL